jgi:hypothetical protein
VGDPDDPAEKLEEHPHEFHGLAARLGLGRGRLRD